MRSVIIHGKKISDRSPREGREDCDLWGVTRANCAFWHGRLLDWTAWVDVHPLVENGKFPGIPERRADAWAWYRAQDGSRPIYLMAPEDHPAPVRAEAQRRFDLVPGAVRFPIREIQAAFPINGEPNRWFVEQTGMMIAHACLLGYARIILNGVGCVTRLDWQIAHRSILYWLAFARGRGVQVEVEGPSIYHTPREIYAYDKFNYEELAGARRFMQRQAGIEEQAEALAALNEIERRRGRPPRYKVPAMEA